jgi:hypothetical protein
MYLFFRWWWRAARLIQIENYREFKLTTHRAAHYLMCAIHALHGVDFPQPPKPKQLSLFNES